MSSTREQNDPSFRRPQEVRQYNRQVWDMVLHLLHPAFFFVVLQVLILSHLGAHPEFRRWDLVVYTAQFLGAWALFYATLMRDMGFKSSAGPILAVVSLAGVLVQYTVFADPLAATAREVGVFLVAEYLPLPFVWLLTLRQWLRLKREHAAPELEQGGAP